MNFPINAYLPAFFAAALVSFLSAPLWRRLCLKMGLVDEPGVRKIHQDAMPLAGGFAVLTGMALPMLAGAFAVHGWGRELQVTGQLLQHGLERRGAELAVLLAGAVAMLGLGALDDRFELRPAVKFSGQLVIALAVAAAGARITLFVHNVIFSYAITALWIVAVTNAFNFLDNMNGLCAGLGAIATGYFALIAAVEGQYLVGLIGLVACGALIGFLPRNFPRATMFLGDAGSHLVGYLAAVLAILPHFYNRYFAHPGAVMLPLLVLAVPLGDLAWVVVLRWRRGQPFYLADNNHLSHRLVQRGRSTTRAVLEIWLLAVVLGALAVWCVLL